MSQIPHLSLSSKGNIDRLLRLQKDIGEAKSKGRSFKSSAALAPSSAREAQKTNKKRQVEVDVDEYDIEDRNICLTFPPTVHAYTDFAPHFEESKKLLFSTDRGTFDHIGLAAVGQAGSSNLIKGVHALLYSNEKALEFACEIKRLKSIEAGLQQEIEALKAALAAAESLAAMRLEEHRIVRTAVKINGE